MKTFLSITFATLLLVPSLVFAQVTDDNATEPTDEIATEESAVDNADMTEDTVDTADTEEATSDDTETANEDYTTTDDVDRPAPSFNYTIVNSPPVEENEVVDDTMQDGNSSDKVNLANKSSDAQTQTAQRNTVQSNNLIVLGGWILVILIFIWAGYLTISKSKKNNSK